MLLCTDATIYIDSFLHRITQNSVCFYPSDPKVSKITQKSLIIRDFRPDVLDMAIDRREDMFSDNEKVRQQSIDALLGVVMEPALVRVVPSNKLFYVDFVQSISAPEVLFSILPCPSITQNNLDSSMPVRNAHWCVPAMLEDEEFTIIMSVTDRDHDLVVKFRDGDQIIAYHASDTVTKELMTRKL